MTTTPAQSRKTTSVLRWSLPLAVFAIIVAFLFVGLFRDPREVPSPLIGKPAPSFSLAELHKPDQRLTSADMRGQVWLLNVWASWCVSCREEHPLLVALAKANVVPVIGLAYKDDPADGRKWLASNGDPYKTSIVDLLKLLGIDSSLDNRKELATELGYTGDKDGSAEMNIWLHKAVMQQLASHGGKVPASLTD